MRLQRFLADFWRDEQGQDLIEYALIVGMLTVSAGFVAPSYIGPPVRSLMSIVVSRLQTPNPT